MTVPERPTARAHREVASVLREGDVAIDATAGNGHDTVFLAGLVGPTGKVIAFDVQEQAIASTRERLAAEGLLERVELVHASHAAMHAYAGPASVTAAMFNLGYLPGGDHELITRTEETLQGLEAAVGVLKPGGLLTIVCYPGHAGGDDESAAVVAWAEKHGAEVFRREDTLKPAPFLVVVRATEA
ncbi:methyltransferase domain-containing protein [Luteolibacter arcticus]|uniref:Methyltransferase domain-containing protein n=1 Tax=Luteolibacter arcticus TaxID=1581411 RepID=A0ABT3GHS1_9BACT|nr:class I SAM-dependent methyltransferase [Luteolibacter arcticus]MCW1923065.1 methyltransferase domain-containing protein [Luteolibacter arcticus]